MKRLAVVGVLAVSGGCFLPTQPSNSGPEAYCAQIGAFYCNTVTLPQDLPNGWPGYCMVPQYAYGGISGYSAVTGNGGATPVYPSTQEAWQACGATSRQPQGACVSVVRCTRPNP